MTSSNIARTDDGTIQINFEISQSQIDNAEVKALADLGKDVTVAGFRKGKAPAEKIKERIDPGKLLEKTLGLILPDLYMKTITENKIKPITYPKFEILKQGETWEIQAKLAELPIFEIGNHKDILTKALKDAGKDKKELSQQEKEDVVLKTLLSIVKITIPKILIDDEVNARLSSLLERTEKLGLKLEQYLASLGKTEQGLREEYTKQVADGISIELILNKLAELEKVQVDEKDVDAAIKQAGVIEEHEGHIEEQKVMVDKELSERGYDRNIISEWVSYLE